MMNSTKLTKKIKLNLTLRMNKKVMMDLELLTSRKPCKITSRAMPPPKETPGRRRTTKEVSKKMISLVYLMTILAQTKMKFTTRREDTKTKKTNSKEKRKRSNRARVKTRPNLLPKSRKLLSQRSLNQRLRKKRQSSH